MTKRVIFFLLTAILCLGLFSCQSGDIKDNSSSATSSSVASEQTLSGKAIGETATSINIETTITAIGKLTDKKPTESGKSYYYVDITIKNIGTIVHDMSITQRFHLLDSNREKTTVESFIGTDGKDMNGKKLLAGESVTGRALFAVSDEFKVAAFTYTFDVNGFGIFTYLAK